MGGGSQKAQFCVSAENPVSLLAACAHFCIEMFEATIIIYTACDHKFWANFCKWPGQTSRVTAIILCGLTDFPVIIPVQMTGYIGHMGMISWSVGVKKFFGANYFQCCVACNKTWYVLYIFLCDPVNRRVTCPWTVTTIGGFKGVCGANFLHNFTCIAMKLGI